MNAVQPIRDKKIIEDIKLFYEEHSERNYTLFCTGIYIPLRITDILSLRVRDVRGKEFIEWVETKTGKKFKIKINVKLRKIYYRYCANKKDYDFLFPSPRKKGYPLSRQQAYYIIQYAAIHFGIKSLGCHSLRKTFGYQLYNQTGNIEMLRRIFNHQNAVITSRYIGLEEDIINNELDLLDY